MTSIDPPLEAQIRRIMTLIDRAADRVERRLKPATPGAALNYARRNPSASLEEIVATTGCSYATAMSARRNA